MFLSRPLSLLWGVSLALWLGGGGEGVDGLEGVVGLYRVEDVGDGRDDCFVKMFTGRVVIRTRIADRKSVLFGFVK